MRGELAATMNIHKTNEIDLGIILIIILSVCLVLVLVFGHIKDKKDSERLAIEASRYTAAALENAVVTIIDNDGTNEFLTNVKPILDKKE
ncbi:hypothetical protein ACJDU8_01640 [Clostridium sp. WILCCON 0269]|uniref:Flp pilus-assembly TadG-like N-terminal domain-containing protein n=1 Tax=Candidatus Clostridium eludens TaxID=3381663 RepID=A0ABW8SE34_9CLOT